jgi:hypothetical protein
MIEWESSISPPQDEFVKIQATYSSTGWPRTPHSNGLGPDAMVDWKTKKENVLWKLY